MMHNPIRSVVIVGSGNVAEALASALRHSPFELRQVFARNAARGTEVAHIGGTEWTDDPQKLATADLYLLAVSDRAVGETAEKLNIPDEAIIAHTAGCVPLEALPEQFDRRAVFYPLQTFTKGREVDFSDIPIFIEASDEALQAAMEAFARELSRMVIPADSDLRARIHLAGVFANNFVNHLFVCAEQILHEAGFMYDLLRPIIRETVAKALDASDPANVQTGPAVRGDRATQERHRALIDDELLKMIYNSISQHIWEISKKI